MTSLAVYRHIGASALAVSASVLMTAAPLIQPQMGARSTWRLVQNGDGTTGRPARAVVLDAAGKAAASLRVHCSADGVYVVSLTLPKDLQLKAPAAVELQFDQKEPEPYFLLPLTDPALIEATGGSPTDANYAVAAIDVSNPLDSLQSPHVRKGGAEVVGELRTSSNLRVRLSAPKGSTETYASFNIQGFTGVDQRAGWKCRS